MIDARKITGVSHNMIWRREIHDVISHSISSSVRADYGVKNLEQEQRRQRADGVVLSLGWGTGNAHISQPMVGQNKKKASVKCYISKTQQSTDPQSLYVEKEIERN